MIYYMYKITNIVNGKVYVGVHQTMDIDDRYMGSGKLIKLAIKKYGLDKFVKEIIKTFETPDEMFLYEAEIVTEEFAKDPMTYNMAPGGSGGSMIRNQKPFTGRHTDAAKKKISEAAKGRVVSDQTLSKLKENYWGKRGNNALEEHIKRVKESNSRPKTERHKLAISAAMPRTPKEVVICPHCGKTGGKAVMKRWHFDRCKSIRYNGGSETAKASTKIGEVSDS